MLLTFAQADRGFKTLQQAVSNDRTHCCPTSRKAGEAAAHVQADFYGCKPRGEAKGRCGRLVATFELPVHL